MTILVIAAVLLIVLDIVALRRSLRTGRTRIPPATPDWSVDGLPSRPYATRG
jgi:hypothetical protein